MEDCGQIWHKLAIIIDEPQDHSCCSFWGGGASTMASKFACCGMQPFCINTVTVAKIFHRKLEELTLGPLQSILCLTTTVVQLKQCCYTGEMSCLTLLFFAAKLSTV